MTAPRQEKGSLEAQGTTSTSSLSARQGTSGLSALPRGGGAKGGAEAARGSWGAPRRQGACDVLPVRRLASRSCRVLSLRAVKVTAGGYRLASPTPPRDAGGTAAARRVAPRAGVCAIQRRHGEARPEGRSRAGSRCRVCARHPWVRSAFWRSLSSPRV